MANKFLQIVSNLNPFQFVRFITLQRLQRLSYYVREKQYRIIFDRLIRILATKKDSKIPLRLIDSADLIVPRIFTHFDQPEVSVIVPVFNNWEHTNNCLTAIHMQTQGISIQVIVADDASTDETRYIKKYFTNLTVVVNKENLGFVGNCNCAAKAAKGKYLVFLNNDTVVQPDWLKYLLAIVKQDEKVGLVGPMLMYPDGRLQEAGGIIWKNADGWNYGCQDYHPEHPEYNYVKETDYISGACILVKKSLWDQLGGFDECFTPAYYEDTDLAFSIRKLGYKVVYQPRSRVVHFEGISHGTDLSTGIKQHQKVNQIKFENKWHEVLQKNHYEGPEDLFLARDRIFTNKILLYIDQCVPMPDRDAGSRSTYQYLKLMAKMGYRIKFIGDYFVDYQPYTSELQSLGIEVLYGRWFQVHWKKWIRKNGKYIDYVYLSRPGIAQKYLPIIKKWSKAKIIYCGHDLYYLRMARKYELDGKNENLEQMHKWEKIENSIVRSADVSYFFSDFEVKELKNKLPNAELKSIPLFLFDDQKEYRVENSIDFDKRQGLLFVGGFMHMPNVDAVMWFIKDVLPIIRASLPDTKFNVVGSNPTKEILKLNSDEVNILGEISDEDLQGQYRANRIVVAPLRYGAGVKGKILESIDWGVPVVTTKIGAEGIYEAEKILAIAQDPQQFAQLVIQLYSNFNLWSERVAKGSSLLREYYTNDNARAILSMDMPLD